MILRRLLRRFDFSSMTLFFFRLQSFPKNSDFAISLIFNFSAHMTYQINRNDTAKCDGYNEFLILLILWKLNEVKVMTFAPLIFFLSPLSHNFLEQDEI